MISKRFLVAGLFGGLYSVALWQTGCGSSTPVSATGGQTTTTSTHTIIHTTTTTASTTTTTGTGGQSGTGCHSFGCAQPITAGATATANTLEDPATPDYYSFTGTKGDRIVITATAVGIVQNPPSDGSITDTVVTLYLPDMQTVWAVNDDAWPRLDTDSVLYTELPESGTYYFTVEDCNALAAVNSNVSCNPEGGITDFNYQAFLGDLTATKTESVGSASATTTVTYTPITGMTGSYYNPTLDGDIAAATDVHTFSVTPPANTTTDPSARSRGYFWVQSIGNADGTGTVLDVVVTATDANNHVLAKADQQFYTNGDDPTNNSLELSFPLDDQFGNKLGSTYTVSYSVSSKTPTITPTKNFYIVDHLGGPFWYGSPEAEGPTGSGVNDTPATAQTLTSPSGDTGSYFVDGNLSSPTDVDWYSFTAPSGTANAYMTCAAARNGSGLRGFTVELFSSAVAGDAGASSIGQIGPEATNPTSDLNGSTNGYAITAGQPVYVKVSLTGSNAGQDPTVAGTYYRCEFDTQ